MAQRPDFFDPAPSVAVSSQSEQQFYGSLADRMAQFSSQQFARAGRKANIEGERAGVKAATAGDMTLKTGTSIASQAYNRGALRVYTAETTTDMIRTLPKIESQAYNDTGDGLTYVERYNAGAAGYRNGLLANMPAEIRPEMEQVLNEQLLKGQSRVAARQAQEQHDEDLAITSQSLSDLNDVASQAAVNGDAELFDATEKLFEDLLAGAMEDGIYSTEDAIKMSTARQKAVAEGVVLGGFDQAYDEGRGIEYIRRFSSKVPENMSAEQHSEMWGKLETRLGRKNKHIEDAEAETDKARTERHREGKRNATLALMKGDEVDLVAMVENDEIDPDWALGKEQRAKFPGPPYDNPETKLLYELFPLEFSEEEITNDPDLTYGTRGAIVESRRALVEDQEDWRGSRQGSEAVRRVRDAVGIPEGIVIAAMSSAAKLEASEALTALYDRIEALPPEQRAQKAIEVADEIVSKTSARRAGDKLARVNARLDSLREERNSYKEGSVPWKNTDQNVKTAERRVKELEKELNQ